jgi:hypothetical protein
MPRLTNELWRPRTTSGRLDGSGRHPVAPKAHGPHPAERGDGAGASGAPAAPQAAGRRVDRGPEPRQERKAPARGPRRTGSREALAVALAGGGLVFAAGRLAVSGEPVGGAILYATGAVTTAIAILLLMGASRWPRRGPAFVLALLAVLVATALSAALVSVGAGAK